MQSLATCYRETCVLPQAQPTYIVVPVVTSSLQNMAFCYQETCLPTPSPTETPIYRKKAAAALLNQAGVDLGFGPAHVGVNWNQLMNQSVGIDLGFGPAHLGLKF